MNQIITKPNLTLLNLGSSKKEQVIVVPLKPTGTRSFKIHPVSAGAFVETIKKAIRG